MLQTMRWILGSLLVIALVTAAWSADDAFEPGGGYELSLSQGGWAPSRPRETDPEIRDQRSTFKPIAGQLRAEFEHQDALLVSCGELVDTAPGIFADLIRATHRHVDILAIVPSSISYATAKSLLHDQSIPHEHVHFVEVPHDTMWTRDYGPMIVSRRSGKLAMIDAAYDPSRPADDRVPYELARLLHAEVVRMPVRLDGGNLISNGAGLALTTLRLFEDNDPDGDIDEVCEVMRRGYGIDDVVILEPLLGEATGHVDMFATFTSANTVVVAQCDPITDAENAAILDRNARRLAQVLTPQGPLRVVRIPMPAHDDGIWRTYTNVIFANHMLLVPVYAGVDLGQRQQMLDTYAALLPGWQVQQIDVGAIIESNGALHCITMNLGPVGQLRNLPQPQMPTREEWDALVMQTELAPSQREPEYVPAFSEATLHRIQDNPIIYYAPPTGDPFDFDSPLVPGGFLGSGPLLDR